MPYFVYVLRSLKDGGYYIGSAENVSHRLSQHNGGRTRSLKHRRPLELVFAEDFANKSDALKREKQLKSYKGGEAFRRLLAERCQSG